MSIWVRKITQKFDETGFLNIKSEVDLMNFKSLITFIFLWLSLGCSNPPMKKNLALLGSFLLYHLVSILSFPTSIPAIPLLLIQASSWDSSLIVLLQITPWKSALAS